MKMVKSMPRVTLFTFIVIFANFCMKTSVSAPYQELAPRKGYVPVYIRIGETPLSEIHPKLVEAFHELESSSLTLENADDGDTKASEILDKHDNENAESLKSTKKTEQEVHDEATIPSDDEKEKNQKNSDTNDSNTKKATVANDNESTTTTTATATPPAKSSATIEETKTPESKTEEEVEVPAIVVEDETKDKSKSKETDIASFDVVKGDDANSKQ